MYRNSIGKLLSLFISFIFVCSVLFCGCNKAEPNFPELTFDDTSDFTSEVTDVNETSSVDFVPHISVALPYSEKTISYLAKLYYLKSNNLLGNSINGGNIDLDYLDAVSVPFIIDSITSSPIGANVSTLSEWANNGGVPDVFISNDLFGSYDEGYISPLNEYLYDDSLIVNGFSAEALYECKLDNVIYGIPYGFSFEMMFANMDYIPQDYKETYAIESLAFVSTLSDISKLDGFLNEIRENYPDINQDEVVPLRKGYELLAQFGNVSDYYVQIVSDWYKNNLTSDSDYSSNADPVNSRHAALWIADSSEVDMWCDYYRDNICFFRLPDINSEQHPLITLYPLCISSQSEYKDFAADFAIFVAMDEDAQRLILRLENCKGIFPMIDSSSVWNSITSNPVYGNIASSIEQQLNSVLFSKNVINNDEYLKVLSEARNVVNSEED